MIKITFLLYILCHIGELIGQNLMIPIEGNYGEDYIIVNYPDWHTISGTVLIQDGFLIDHKCGTKTYDGHQGTDFVIRSFPQMDSGVNVLASASGEIIYVIDSLFDKETEGIDSLSLGNYIGIYHALTNTYSYYAHLKKNSVIVQVGDLVSGGQIIGQVGSSGNSTDPHLHYELWNTGLISDPTIDPWGTPCDSGNNLWQNPPIYDTSFAIWECGLVDYNSIDNFIPSTWDPLKERLGQKDNFTLTDPFFTFWNLQYGLKIGDETRIEWYEPNGDLYYSETEYYLNQDWWFHYFTNSITAPPISKQGLWNIKYFYNNQLQQNKSFTYGENVSLEKEVTSNKPYYYMLDNGSVEIVLSEEVTYSILTVYNIVGEIVLEKNIYDNQNINLYLPDDFAGGFYFISISNNSNQITLKVLFD